MIIENIVMIRKRILTITVRTRICSHQAIFHFDIHFDIAVKLEKPHTLFFLFKGHKFDMSLTQRCVSI